jgi:hypothetical protein
MHCTLKLAYVVVIARLRLSWGVKNNYFLGTHKPSVFDPDYWKVV